MTKDTLEYWLKVVGSLLAAGSLFLGAAQFIRNQTVEAAKPYLQAKLKWCEEAVEKTSEIATSDPGAAAAKSTARFWQLYWGLMGLVENEQVTQAMIGFGNALNAKESPDILKGRSIALAHACRTEMAASWSPVWTRSR
ncbi:MAG: hypothetical protein ACHQ7H_02815 [Candidatus Rokuibacteriota bacterium]|jgi:hypothetical protein